MAHELELLYNKWAGALTDALMHSDTQPRMPRDARNEDFVVYDEVLRAHNAWASVHEHLLIKARDAGLAVIRYKQEHS